MKGKSFRTVRRVRVPASLIAAIALLPAAYNPVLAQSATGEPAAEPSAQQPAPAPAPAAGLPAPAGPKLKLETITVETKASEPKAKAKPKASASSSSASSQSVASSPAPVAPPAAPAPGTSMMTSAIGPVDGYVATNSATGTKTNTPILETPQVVSVVTADQIEDQGVQSVSQALRYTPGVSVELNGASSRYSELRIRGFTPVQYLDGMALPLNQFFATPLINLYGLERIDVLKGPGSFLYGQNSPGGLLSMVSKRPRADAFNEVQLQIGSFGLVRSNFDFGGSAGGDGRFLYRMVGSIQDAETEVDFTRDDVMYLAPSFTWNPQAGTSLTVLATYGEDKGTFPHQYLPAHGVVLPNPNGRIPRSRFAGEPGFDKFEREQYSIGYALEHEIDDTWSFRQNLRYFGVDTYFQAMRGEGLQADMRTLNRNAFSLESDAQTFTVDNQLQAKFATGVLKHDVLFGLDYLRTTGDYAFNFALTAPTLDIYNPVYGGVIGPFVPLQKNFTTQNQVGIYVQDQIKLDNWILTLGGRGDWVENETDDLLAGTTVTREDTAFTGRAALQYVFGNGIAPYVSYGTSFQPTAGVDVAGQPFKPTTGEQFEVGVKYQPFGANTLIQVAAFDITQQNSLTFDPVTFAGTQSGEVQVRGFDVEVGSQLTRNLQMIAGYAFLDTETTASANAFEIGRPVPLVPRHDASLWAKYTFDEGPFAGLGLSGGVRYVSETYAAFPGVDAVEIPGYTLVDAGVSYDLGNLDRSFEGAEIQVNVNNVFDKYYAQGYCDVIYCSLGAGRTVLTTLSYKW